MSASISFHIHSDRNNTEGTLTVESYVQKLNTHPEQRSACVALRKGMQTVNLYFDSIEDMEKVEFHLSTLIRDARDAWADENNK